MNLYEKKQAERRERLLKRAARADAEAKAAYKAGDVIAQGIPLGQPILVGHHSEKRHRRDLAKIDRAMRKSIDADKKAAELRHRAASVGTAGVSSDDPDAMEKLAEKLASLERDRDRMKAINAAFKRGGWPAVLDRQLVSAAQVERLERDMTFVPGGTELPFPSYVFTNTSAEIRRVRLRLAELRAGPPTFEPIEGPGWRIEARPEINRVAVELDKKPAPDVIAKFKRGGWRWSPREGAWLRHLNQAGLSAAEQVIQFLPAGPAPARMVKTPPAPSTKPASQAPAEPAKKTALSAKPASAPASSATPARTTEPAKGATRRSSATKPAKAKRSKPVAKASAPKRSKAATPKARKKARGRKRKKKGHTTEFARWVTHPVTGKRLRAEDYGYKAFPLRAP
ncbi:MAG: DUF3560 domain-containing protein [Sandaracinaceae bacterium]|nr:DUF3560 domain-containing protein [Sandaracinaceae bacterium]